jgi:hypothetical protein
MFLESVFAKLHICFYSTKFRCLNQRFSSHLGHMREIYGWPANRLMQIMPPHQGAIGEKLDFGVASIMLICR